MYLPHVLLNECDFPDTHIQKAGACQSQAVGSGGQKLHLQPQAQFQAYERDRVSTFSTAWTSSHVLGPYLLCDLGEINQPLFAPSLVTASLRQHLRGVGD